MGRTVGGVALLLLSLSMLLGFVRSDAALSSPATVAALLITVALPGVSGILLMSGRIGRGKRLAARRDRLRQQTFESEILRLAAQRGGRLTVVEIMTEFAIPQDQANALLESLVVRELADIEITDSGVVVYAFHDVKHLDDKTRARRMLDA
ncbi:MAG TPA: hypothetical protein VFU01_06605 [Gemmatimonadaceae bacterium]|nr:hypothetical protein [Gemmatimonadaceae bacterium]